LLDLFILKFKAINDCHPIKGDTFHAVCVETLFPARENLVSDIPAGTGKSLIFFYSVQLVFNFVKFAPTATFFPLHFQKSLGQLSRTSPFL
jgi:hypothetical protein